MTLRNGAITGPMTVRRLRRTDVSRYRQLMLDGYHLHPDAFTASVAERGVLPLAWWEARLADGERPDELVMGAWDADDLVGAAGLRFETRPKTRHKASLFGMYVRCSAARAGVGTRLVEALLAQARERCGIRIVQLTVTDGNRAAQALYARCGFIAFGTEPLAITTADGYADKLHLWIDLGPSPVPCASSCTGGSGLR